MARIAIACHPSQSIIMYHPRFKLITPNRTVNLDPNQHSESDIEEESRPNTKPPHALPPPTHSLLSSIKLKQRVELSIEEKLKLEAVELSSEEQQSYREESPQSQESQWERDSSSLVFVRKVTNDECLKKKLRRLATVPNKVKLEKKDQTTVQCSICLSDLKNAAAKSIGKLRCGHYFCFSCIMESSKFATKCPYCRTPYTEILKGNRAIKVQEVIPNEDLDDPLDEPCYVCGRNDDFERLLECEYCEYAYCHTYCDTRLHSHQPPQSTWYCLSCTDLLRNQGQASASFEEIYEQSESAN